MAAIWDNRILPDTKHIFMEFIHSFSRNWNDHFVTECDFEINRAIYYIGKPQKYLNHILNNVTPLYRVHDCIFTNLPSYIKRIDHF